MTSALAVQGMTKRFPGVLANDRVDLDVARGEVHAVLGENGAGKSTLMNLLYGMHQPDAGQILRDGKPVTIRSPSDAIALGIGMVHQHFMLIPVFSVVENIMLGAEALRAGRALDRRKVSAEVRDISREYGLEVDPGARVEDLPVGVQQRVEIVKALHRKAQILILDEPTAVLTQQEVGDLLRVMRGLTARGVSILFITHKLKEVLAVADRITVMRAGRVVGTAEPAETDERALATMMVGREVVLSAGRAIRRASGSPDGAAGRESQPAEPARDVLSIEGLCVAGRGGQDAVRGASLSVRAGEIVGIAGVLGNGQSELAEAITGLRPPRRGKVLMLGRDVTGAPPRALIEAGLSHIPEDRQLDGLVLSYSVADNMMLCSYHKPPFAVRGVLRDGAIEDNARRLVADFDVRTPGPFAAVGTLSGGNQQKVIIARELSRPVKLLVANQPTRGLDVGAIEYIHRQIVAVRDQGAAVLLLSAELDEILALSDRIAVMYRGEIVAMMEAGEATREALCLRMAGGAPEGSGEGDEGVDDPAPP